MSDVLSAAILLTFVGLVIVGAVSTTLRYLRYLRHGMQVPVLLPRDRDLFLGLAIPFALIGLVRVFPGLREWILTSDGKPEVWWLLLTGVPPIYAAARYCYFELFRIER